MPDKNSTHEKRGTVKNRQARAKAHTQTFVALSASSTRNFFSFSSVSV
jgi:hypothetical protein